MPPPNQVRPPGKPEGDIKDHAGSEVNDILPPTADIGSACQVTESQPDPFCGRCHGTSGPEGAWCDDCIRECKGYTRRLDLGEAAA